MSWKKIERQVDICLWEVCRVLLSSLIILLLCYQKLFLNLHLLLKFTLLKIPEIHKWLITRSGTAFMLGPSPLQLCLHSVAGILTIPPCNHCVHLQAHKWGESDLRNQHLGALTLTGEIFLKGSFAARWSIFKIWGFESSRNCVPTPARLQCCESWCWVASRVSLTTRCLAAAAPTPLSVSVTGTAGRDRLPSVTLATGRWGLWRGQWGDGRSSVPDEPLNNSPFSSDSSALPGQK